MDSIWQKECTLQAGPRLRGNRKADAVVIGAGMAGLLTAYALKNAGLSVLVLEADTPAGGQTGRTTAKITAQHGLKYTRLIAAHGEEKAARYAAASMEAVRRFRAMTEEKQISCHFETLPAYLYATDESEKLEQEAEAARKLGIPARLVRETELPFPVCAAVEFPEQAQFNPLEFLAALLPELEVCGGTAAREIEGNVVFADGGQVEAEHIVIATHYPFVNLQGYYFARMHQERSYVLALENAPKLGGMYIGDGETSYSFRGYGSYLLLGGAGHRTGENTKGGCYADLRVAANRFFPEAKEACAWSAQDCITLDGIPYIGRFTADTPRTYVAAGFAKWGMTGSMTAAMLLRDLITGRESPYEEVFCPQRFRAAASLENLMKEGAHAVGGLTKQLIPTLTALDELEPGHGGVVEYNGKKLGAYREENGELHFVSTRCPHLGCQLEWNPDEKTWDCPCHGSRFTYRGELLDNPATGGLEIE